MINKDHGCPISAHLLLTCHGDANGRRKRCFDNDDSRVLNTVTRVCRYIVRVCA